MVKVGWKRKKNFGILIRAHRATPNSFLLAAPHAPPRAHLAFSRPAISFQLRAHFEAMSAWLIMRWHTASVVPVLVVEVHCHRHQFHKYPTLHVAVRL